MVEPVANEFDRTLMFAGNSWVLIICPDDSETYLIARETSITLAEPIHVSDAYFLTGGREKLVELCKSATKDEIDGILSAAFKPA